MIIWGKLAGATMGLILYDTVGVVLGLVFGHIFDNGLQSIMNGPVHTAEVRAVFFRVVFQTIDYIAKSNGVVSNEIKVARNIMLHDFNLNKEQMLLAIDFFNMGKAPSFNIDATINNFKAVCGRYKNLSRFF